LASALPDASTATVTDSRTAFQSLAASGRPALLFVVHGWGGGVRRHVDDLAALVAPSANVLLLEPLADGFVRLASHRAPQAA
jgi:hypothetical protein